MKSICNRGFMGKLDLIVTRHPGLVTYLREIGLADAETAVVTHATPDVVKGKRVCGVLPHSLSCLCDTFTEVPLDLPQELRGAELTVEQVRQFARPAVTYRVEVLL
jgi:putative CRISPR-associated protein (TIGR02620 family)